MSWILLAGLSIISYKFLSDKINAWARVYSNDLYTEIPLVLLDMQPPEVIISDTYQPKTSMYAIDLIRRFSEAVYYNQDMVIPDKLRVLGLISYDKYEPSLAIVLSDDDGHIWIVVRGTHTSTDFQHDTMFHQVPIYPDQPYFKVHEGFYKIFRMVMPKIYTLFRHYGNVKKITVTGHSMGGAVGTLIAYDLYDKKYQVNAYIYASPRVVNFELSNNIGFKIFRIDNTEDIVATKPPPLVISLDDTPNTYNHVGEAIIFSENRLSFERNHTIPVYYDFVFSQYNKRLEIQNNKK
jgi:triacylglycerol lipase